MMHRAAKLWTRRIQGLRSPGGNHERNPHVSPGTDGRIELDFIVGYEQLGCQSIACASHDDSTIWLTPVYFTRYPHAGKVTIGRFRILGHEFGHIVDHLDPITGGIHSDCADGPSIICDPWGPKNPVGPSNATSTDSSPLRCGARHRPRTVRDLGGGSGGDSKP